MADVDLSGISQGTTSLTAAMLAAAFMGASSNAGAGASAASRVSHTDMTASSAGVSQVESSVVRGASIEGRSDVVSSVAASIVRQRGVQGKASAQSDAIGSAGVRSGLQAQAAGAALLQGLVGRNRPIQAQSEGSASGNARLESGSISHQDIFLQVTGDPVFNNDADIVTGDPGTWTVPVTLRRGGVPGSLIPAGSAVVKWGEYSELPSSEFTGGVLITSDQDNAPYIDIFTVDKHSFGGALPWDDAALKTRTRAGNLRGVLGNSHDKWGIALGADLSDHTKPFIEASNEGVRLSDVDLSIVNGVFYVGDEGENTYLKWDGNSLTIRGDGSGITNIDGGNIQAGTITADKITLGTQAVTLNPMLYLGFSGPTPYNTNFSGSLMGHLGQAPIEAENVAFVRGKYGKAVLLGTAATNLLENPSFESYLSETEHWDVFGNGVVERSMDQVYYGKYSLKITAGSSATLIVSKPHSASTFDNVLASVYVYVTGDPEDYNELLQIIDATTLEPLAVGGPTKANEWHRVCITAAMSSNRDVRLRIQNQKTDSESVIYVDAAQFEIASNKFFPSAYVDGTMPGCHWVGTEHNSASVRAQSSLSYDVQGNISPDSWTVMLHVYPDPQANWPSAQFLRIPGYPVGESDGSITILQIGPYLLAYVAAQTLTFGETTGYEWVHLAVTFDVTTMTLRAYMNGELVDEVVTNPENCWQYKAGERIYLGGPFSDVLIDEVVTLDYALSETDIHNVATSKVPINVSKGSFDLFLGGGESGGWVTGNGDGIIAYDVNGNRQLMLSTDGSLKAGPNDEIIVDSSGIQLRDMNDQTFDRASLGFYTVTGIAGEITSYKDVGLGETLSIGAPALRPGVMTSADQARIDLSRGNLFLTVQSDAPKYTNLGMHLNAYANIVDIMSTYPGLKLSLAGDLDVSGDADIWGSLAASSLSLSGNASVGGTLSVTGVTTLNNNLNSRRIYPRYTTWSAGPDGGAAIVNDNGTYKSLMIAGNTSGGGGVRRIDLYDDVTVYGRLQLRSNLSRLIGSTYTNGGIFIPFSTPVKIWDATNRDIGDYSINLTSYNVPSGALGVMILIGGRFQNTSGYLSVARSGQGISNFNLQISGTTTNDFIQGVVVTGSTQTIVCYVRGAAMDVAYLYMLGYFI